MMSSHEEYPPRRKLPQQLRNHDATGGPPSNLLVHHQRQPQRQHQHPTHQPLSPETEMAPIGGAQIFALFYSLIFSVVHAALTMVFTPVLGNGKGQRQPHIRCESSPRSLSPPNNFIIPEKSHDPELAMPDSGSSSDSGGSSCHHPILKTQSTSSSRSRCCGEGYLSSTDENKKVVHFPGQGRVRPPLGRIERLSSLSSVSFGGSTTSSLSSSSRNSCGMRRERSRPSTHQTIAFSRGFIRSSRSSSGPTPRTPSPFCKMASPRMAHSTYFLE